MVQQVQPTDASTLVLGSQRTAILQELPPSFCEKRGGQRLQARFHIQLQLRKNARLRVCSSEYHRHFGMLRAQRAPLPQRSVVPAAKTYVDCRPTRSTCFAQDQTFRIERRGSIASS